MYTKTLISASILAMLGHATAFSGRVYCDQGDAGITAAFAGQILSSVDTSSTFGVPGNGKDPAFEFASGCLSTSQRGASSCCQVAFQQLDGKTGTVTMTSNKKSTGADSLGGIDGGTTLSAIAHLILTTCWSALDNSLHSGRWAGQGDLGDSGYQVGLSGGTC